jgi:predicted outer membrane repeat protein
MKIFTKFFTLFTLLILSIGISAQTTYYVSQEGSDENDGLTEETAFATLYKALEQNVGVADSGDVIMVIDTVLNVPDSIEIDGTWEYLEDGYAVNKLITLEGMGNNAVVDINGKAVWKGVYCFGGEFTVKNLTFISSVQDDEISKSIMKLHNTYNKAHIKIENCTFKSLPSKAYGGIINIIGHDVTIDNCTFIDCSGDQGGAILLDGALNVGGSDDIPANYKCTVNITGSAFINNTARNNGGAIMATTGYQVVRNEYSPIDLNITNTTFYGNSSERDPSKGGGNAGAILLTGEHPIKGVTPSEELSNVTLTNVTIVGNHTRKNASSCGGIKFADSRPGTYELNNCLIYGNVAMQESTETGETNPVPADYNGGTKVESDDVTEHMEVIMKNSIVGTAYAGYDDENSVAEETNITSVDSEFGVYNNVEGITATIDTIILIVDSVESKGVVMFNNDQLPYDFGLLSHLGEVTVDQIGNERGNLPFGAVSVGAWEYNDADLGLNTSISSYTKENTEVFVYPNPINELSVINIPSGLVADINLYSITGALVKSLRAKGTIAFPYQELNSGLYFIEMRTGRETIVQKVIVK